MTIYYMGLLALTVPLDRYTQYMGLFVPVAAAPDAGCGQASPHHCGADWNGAADSEKVPAAATVEQAKYVQAEVMMKHDEQGNIT